MIVYRRREIDLSSKEPIWRNLSAMEIALTKRMRERGMARDKIHSFINRAGRTLTPAYISELENGKGPPIPAATDAEVDTFMKRKIMEADNFISHIEDSPFSSLRVRDLLIQLESPQLNLFSDESDVVEYKRQLPTDKRGFHLTVKSMAAFANHVGGYILFGVNDRRKPVGLLESQYQHFDWDRLSGIARSVFQPSIDWSRALVEIDDKLICAINIVEQKTKPVIATKDGEKIEEGSIYRRYNGASEKITAGDLQEMLRQRDRKVLRERLR